MQIRHETPVFKITTQISPDMMAEIHKNGIKSIICNRPDNESEDQCAFEKIRESAEKYGIAAYHYPISVGSDPQRQIQSVISDYNTIQKPILAFCKSGTRSSFILKGLRKHFS